MLVSSEKRWVESGGGVREREEGRGRKGEDLGGGGKGKGGRGERVKR